MLTPLLKEIRRLRAIIDEAFGRSEKSAKEMQT